MNNYKILGKVEYKRTKEFDVKVNGIQIVENENKVEIYNDPFRVIPLFIIKDKSDKLIIFSDYEDFYNLKDVDKTIDKAGFWEIILFGNGVFSRTLYKNVRQMPSASKIIIDKNTNKYKIERYWDFNIEVDDSIDSMEKAAQGMYDRIDSIFAKLDKNTKYIMGMSGGMDSRISLAFLSKYIPKENLKLFTYGFDEKILEYKYACEVAKTLGYDEPEFHKLTARSYRRAMDYLPKMSGGQVGINHCHILDYLQGKNLNNFKQISNYISDAIFGLNTKKEKNNDLNNLNVILDKYKNNFSNKIYQYILSDIELLIENFQSKFNYTNVNEYIYWTEKTPKVFNYFSKLHSEYINQELIYADYDLLVYSLSIPPKYREQKKVLDYLLDNYFKNIPSSGFKNISSRFLCGSEFSGLLDFYSFKILNRINATLRLFTKGYIQLFNKYQTEEQDRLLYRDFHKDLKNATSKFVDVGIMSKEQKKQWDKLPLKNGGISERFVIISLSKSAF
jgi:hypothetical protein